MEKKVKLNKIEKVKMYKTVLAELRAENKKKEPADIYMCNSLGHLIFEKTGLMPHGEEIKNFLPDFWAMKPENTKGVVWFRNFEKGFNDTVKNNKDRIEVLKKLILKNRIRIQKVHNA
jgi:hypothetical protein